MKSPRLTQTGRAGLPTNHAHRQGSYPVGAPRPNRAISRVPARRTPHLAKNFVVFTALALPALTHLSAVAQTCPDNIPHVTGTWTLALPYQMPINPISANLLPNGKGAHCAGIGE